MPRRRASDGLFNEMDISGALRGWNFASGQVNVRMIRGNDGKPKLQMRLDLGVLQMELDGRPDGRRPHRRVSELDYQRDRVHAHTQRHGSEAGFELTGKECEALREESVMFYHRYLSLFVLEQYAAVVRDTQHNLDVLDLCRRFGKTDFDRMVLEQYRPYILMMNTRAKACEALREGFVRTALAYLRGGIKQLARLVPREHRRTFLRQSSEARVLVDMMKQIREQLPADPRAVLRRQLGEALKSERFEEAAKLRDRLTEVTAMMAAGGPGPAKMKPRAKRSARAKRAAPDTGQS